MTTTEKVAPPRKPNAAKLTAPSSTTEASDTVVVDGGRVLTKPVDAADAVAMLLSFTFGCDLSGMASDPPTAVCAHIGERCQLPAGPNVQSF